MIKAILPSNITKPGKTTMYDNNNRIASIYGIIEKITITGDEFHIMICDNSTLHFVYANQIQRGDQ